MQLFVFFVDAETAAAARRQDDAARMFETLVDMGVRPVAFASGKNRDARAGSHDLADGGGGSGIRFQVQGIDYGEPGDEMITVWFDLELDGAGELQPGGGRKITVREKVDVKDGEAHLVRAAPDGDRERLVFLRAREIR